MHYDVAVVGAGPVGAVAARLLATAGLSVVLIDRARARRFKAGETLPPVANPLLRRLGLWDLLDAGHIRCPGNLSAFGSHDLAELDFVYSAHGCGWHLDRMQFESELRDSAGAVGVDVVTASLTGVEQCGPQTQLTLDTGARVSAGFVIDASGGARAVLRRIGVEEQRLDRLVACIGLYDCTKVQDHRTMIEAAKGGWWYSSGLPGGRRAVMYFTDADLPQFRQVQAEFDAAIQSTRFISLGLRSCGASGAANLFVEPAHSAHAAQVAGQGWLAIGDAAMRFDPLSSQGLWTGLMSAERAVTAVLSGSETALRSYAEWCRRTYADYLAERHTYYAMETRWRDQDFWQRRQEVSGQTASVPNSPHRPGESILPARGAAG